MTLPEHLTQPSTFDAPDDSLPDAVRQQVERKVEYWKSTLYDFSRRNRLLYFKSSRGSALDITYPTPTDLFDRVVVKGKTLTFALQGEIPTETMPGGDRDDDGSDDGEGASAAATARYKANDIGTPATDKALTRTLTNLYNRSRQAREEQGFNQLFLIFGFLNWIDPQKVAARAPLLLVPVELVRPSVAKPYQLAMLEEDIVLNPTLQERMRREFNIRLPEPPHDLDTEGLYRFWQAVGQAVRANDGWSVTQACGLSILSFQDLIIVKDLERNHERVLRSPIIQKLSGVAVRQKPRELVAAAEIDDKVRPRDVFQIMDADSSQQEAIFAATAGLSFVLQGPPGTGKSQTITNIIAEFLADGKRVLFVSEKMAALEVVYRRLAQAGLGPYCLEVHSHNRNKREVVQALGESLRAPDVVSPPDYAGLLERLQRHRDRLKAYVTALHKPRFALGLSVYQLYGRLAQLTEARQVPFALPYIDRVTRQAMTGWDDVLSQLAEFPQVLDIYAEHPWRGARIEVLTFQLRNDLTAGLTALAQETQALKRHVRHLARAYQLPTPGSLAAARNLIYLAQHYTPQVLALPLASLIDHYGSYAQQRTKMLRPAFWRDQGVIEAVRRDGSVPDDDAVVLRDLNIAAHFARTRGAQDATGQAAVSVTPADVDAASRQFRVVSERLAWVLGHFADDAYPRVIRQHEQTSIDALAAWALAQAGRMDELRDWVSFYRLWKQGQLQGLTPFFAAAVANKLTADELRPSFFRQFYSLLVDMAVQQDGDLAGFDSGSHSNLVRGFRSLDREHIDKARVAIQARLSSERPKASWMTAASAEESILRREMNKKRRLKPLRQLFNEIPELLLKLRPCLMMSPYTVSQLLDPALHAFDVVIFDEASQIPPGHALAAFFRGRQMIVVGDRHQLPPTAFFKGDDAGEYGDDSDEFESILNECDAAGFPSKMLTWHYRSRDESLIAFSNLHFYDNRLFTFPPAHHENEDYGLSFDFVPDGVFDRNANMVEARRVVDLVFAHYERHPTRTLGVIAFSLAQANAIRMELENRQRADASLEALVPWNAQEPFFVKHLEIVQGDERDAVIFSVGYGKDTAGKFRLNFGPLNREGGERRLNVAVTRARYQVQIVASFHPEEIDTQRAQSRGARLLRSYMMLARDGVATLRQALQAAGDQRADAAFVDAVSDALTEAGLTVRQQVGVSDYKLDLAIVDPENPNAYLLGIECDGEMYRAAATTRDRDRLRAQVLEGLGWRLHRIWSRDWIEYREREVSKVLALLQTPDAALQTSSGGATTGDEQAVTGDTAPDTMVTTQPILAAIAHLTGLDDDSDDVRDDDGDADDDEVADRPEGVADYRRIDYMTGLGGLDGFYSTTIDVRLRLISAIAQAEGPIHERELRRRIGQVWQIDRTTAKMKREVETALLLADGQGLIAITDGFVWPPGMTTPPVRVPQEGEKPRRLAHIAIEELTEGAYLVMDAAQSIDMQDLLKETARLFGWRVTAKNKARLQVAADSLLESGRVEFRSGKLRLPRD